MGDGQNLRIQRHGILAAAAICDVIDEANDEAPMSATEAAELAVALAATASISQVARKRRGLADGPERLDEALAQLEGAIARLRGT